MNPLRGKILDFCKDKGVKVVLVSNHDLSVDVSALFGVSQVISGSSALGRELSLASLSCEAIYTACSSLRVEVDSGIPGKHSLDAHAPSISVDDDFCYPSPDEWKNLECRYQWLLNN